MKISHIYTILVLSILTHSSLIAQEVVYTSAQTEKKEASEALSQDTKTEVATENKEVAPSEALEEAKTTKDETKSIFFVGVEDLAQKADEGDLRAQVTLAGYFLYGTIVKQNNELAALYFAKAGDAGDMESAYNAGVLYQELIGVVEGADELAFKYFKIAANSNMNAMFNLGACYTNSIGTRKDLIKAYYCFSKTKDEIKQSEAILRQLESALGRTNLERAKAFLEYTKEI